jgi:hypothetical protein
VRLRRRTTALITIPFRQSKENYLLQTYRDYNNKLWNGYDYAMISIAMRSTIDFQLLQALHLDRI